MNRNPSTKAPRNQRTALITGASSGIGEAFAEVFPGFTRSEFHDVTGTRAKVNQLPPWMWLDAPTVARGDDAVSAGAAVFVVGRVNRAVALLARMLPPRLLVAIGRSAAHRYRQSQRHPLAQSPP